MSGFENVLGWYALLALIPFIIIYLRSPRPTTMEVPSLMFLMKQHGQDKKVSFLQKLIRNVLFYLQLLAIIALALVIVRPFVTIDHSVSSDNTVIIIDNSASMQAQDRFGRAIAEAKQRLDGRVTVIEATQSPRDLLVRGSTGEANRVLSQIIPKATRTNVGEAMLLANDLLDGRSAAVLVFSDFLSNEGADIMLAKKTLEESGKQVEFIDYADEANNIGFIDIEVSKQESRVFVKNYNGEEKTVTINLRADGQSIATTELSIDAQSIESFMFETPAGVSELTLSPGDDFDIDNKAIISIPVKKQVSVLLITNEKNSHLEAALKASADLGVDVAVPPVVPKMDHDIVIMHNIQSGFLLPGTFQEIRSYVQDGGAFIMAAQASMPDTLGILPVEIGALQNRPGRGCLTFFDSIFPPDEFTQDPCVLSVTQFLTVTAKNGSAIRMEEDSTRTPMIIEKDKVVFYNIIDESSDFKSLAQYPIFWSKIIDQLVQPQSVGELNHKTGDLVSIPETEVTTPTQKYMASVVVFDEQGLYTIDDKKIAVNLLSDKESDVGSEHDLDERLEDFSSGITSEKADIDLALPLAILVLFLFLIEFIFVKVRGDF